MPLKKGLWTIQVPGLIFGILRYLPSAAFWAYTRIFSIGVISNWVRYVCFRSIDIVILTNYRYLFISGGNCPSPQGPGGIWRLAEKSGSCCFQARYCSVKKCTCFESQKYVGIFRKQNKSTSLHKNSNAAQGTLFCCFLLHKLLWYLWCCTNIDFIFFLFVKHTCDYGASYVYINAPERLCIGSAQ